MEKPWPLLKTNTQELNPFTNRKHQRMINMVVLISLIPHCFENPIWISASAFLILIYRILQDSDLKFKTKYLPTPTTWSMRMLAFISMGGILFQFKTLIGQESGSAFLVLLMTLKLLESKTYRDAMIIIILSYFVHMTWLLISQTLSTTIYLAFAVVYSTQALISLHSSPQQKQKTAKAAVWDLAQALPLFLLMFVLFPRFSSPIAGLFSQGGAKTGFTGEINPTGITELTNSNEPAFRVIFKKGFPRYRDLYWRGSTLTETDGFAWKKSNMPLSQQQNTKMHPVQKVYEQEILIEPKFGRWLFALDTPNTIEWNRAVRNRIQRQVNGDYQAQYALTGRMQYNAWSSTNNQPIRITDAEKNI